MAVIKEQEPDLRLDPNKPLSFDVDQAFHLGGGGFGEQNQINQVLGFLENPPDALGLTPGTRGAIGALTPQASDRDQFRKLADRFEGAGLSSAAAASAAQRVGNRSVLQRADISRALLSQLRSLQNRLGSRAGGISTSSDESAFLTGFLG